MRYTTLLLLILGTLRAQSAPDAATLLKRSDHALDSHPNFRYEWRSTSTGGRQEGPRWRTTSSGSAVGRNDGKWRVEASNGGTLTSDGSFTWIYDGHGNYYDHADFLPSGIRLGVLYEAGISDARIFHDPVGEVREEKIEVDGRFRDCWVVTTVGPSSWNMQVITWIDKELWIDWKIVRKPRVTKEFGVETTVEKSSLSFDSALPDSLFEFAPPPGSSRFCCWDMLQVH